MSLVVATRVERPVRAAAALFVARVVYAFNWYNIGAVLPLIGSSLRLSTAELGVVVGAFLVGVGIFQIPAGFASLRWGARSVSLAGLTVMSLAGIASAFANGELALAGTRFLAGVGAAFFFSPALGLIASYFPPGQRGPIIGWYNGGFSIGGAVGLFGGALLGASYGWAAALGFGGVALLVTTAAAAAVLPAEPARTERRSVGELWADGRAILRSRSIWALSIALTGFWGAIYTVAQFFVKYAHDTHPEWGVGYPAALVAAVVIVAFPGGPVGGWLAELGYDRRVVIAAFGALASLMVLMIPFTPPLGLWAVFLVLGFVDGVVFAVLYLIPTYLPESGGSGLALGVGVINSIQVLLGSGLSVAFAVVAGASGYTTAWIFAGAISFATLPLLLLVVPNRNR